MEIFVGNDPTLDAYGRCMGRGLLTRGWIHLLWTAGLVFGWLTGFLGIALLGVSSLLSSIPRTGEDWAWSGALCTVLIGLPVLGTLLVLAWIKGRAAVTKRTWYLGYASMVLAATAVTATLLFALLPDGAG